MRSRRGETPFLLGPGIFAVVHRPEGEAALPGWLLCSPFGGERTNSQRLFVSWARYLAAAGHWVMRFDYRGTGDSLGDFEAFTLRDYLEDIGTAAGELERLSGRPIEGLLGLRLGADLAAMFASASDRPLTLVMWEPVIDGGRYADSLLRTAMANELVNLPGPHRTRADLRRQLAEGGLVSADGFPLTAASFDSVAGIDLPRLGRPTAGPVLILQFNSRRNQPPKPATAKLAELYGKTGDTTLECVREPNVWMKTKLYRWHLDSAFEITRSWIGRHGAAGSPGQTAQPDATAEPATAAAGEHAVQFEVEGERVWGILHEPVGPGVDGIDIVMASAGEACRAAFFYPRLARALARRGWRVLRFDPRGIGDSEGTLECAYLSEVFHKIESGALRQDLSAAMDFLDGRGGPRQHAIVGLCGGAITALFAAQGDGRVRGLGLLDFSLQLTPEPNPDKQPAISLETPWHEELAQHRSTLPLLKVRKLYHAIRSRGLETVHTVLRTIRFRSAASLGSRRWYRERIGDDVNLPLIAALEDAISEKVPMCFVFAGNNHDRLLRSILPGVSAGRPHAESLIDVKVLEDADHNFIMPGCAERLTDEVVAWFEHRFRLQRPGEAEGPPARADVR